MLVVFVDQELNCQPWVNRPFGTLQFVNPMNCGQHLRQVAPYSVQRIGFLGETVKRYYHFIEGYPSELGKESLVVINIEVGRYY